MDIKGQCPTKQIVTIHLEQNIITTLCGTDISKVEEGHNDDDDDDDDDDDNDTNILDEAIEAPTNNDYHEPQPQHPNLSINHPPRSQIAKASQS